MTQPRKRPNHSAGSLREWDAVAETDLLRHFAPRNFWLFFCWIFGASANPKGERWIDPEVHEPIAAWFQKHIDEWFEKRENGRGEQKHLAVLMHREVGKTTMFTLAGQLWLHLRDPEISTYIGSESLKQSQDMLAAIKAVFDGSDPYALFPKLFGNWSSSARTWTGTQIVHTGRKNTARREPSIGVFAVETSIVGAHPDGLFYDDPISYPRLKTDTNWLQSVNGQVDSLIPVIQSDGLVVWPGTRYDSDMDHFGRAFREQGVATLEGMATDSITPVEGGMWHVYFMAGRKRETNDAHPKGIPSTPKVWPERRMANYEKTNVIEYSAQVMNDPTSSGHNPLTIEQTRQRLVKADTVPWHSLRYAVCCDTAFADSTRLLGKDETVMIVHGFPRNGSGDVYVIEGHGSATWRAEDFANQLIALVQRYRRLGRHIFRITDEMTGAGKKDAWNMALISRFNDAGTPMPGGKLLEFKRGGTKKYDRLVTAASFWVDNHVWCVEGAPGIDRLMEQMSRIGQYAINDKIKIDWADAHSDAFQPQLYQPQRRAEPARAYLAGAQAIGDYGRLFADDEYSQWRNENPRLPERSP
jgi:hypothetical protein